MVHRTAPGIAMQEPTPTECHHSKLTFDAAFHAVRDHPGLTRAARDVHGTLVTLLRTGRLGRVRLAEIAEEARVSVRSAIRATKQLVAAGFLKITRLGQGRPNDYELTGLDPQALAGRSAKTSPPEVPKRQPPARAGTMYPKKKDKEPEYRPKVEADASTGLRSASRCWVCPGRHPLDACPEFPRRR